MGLRNLIFGKSARTGEQAAAKEEPVYAVLDWEQCQNVESDQKHDYEFDVRSDRIGQRFLIIPNCPEK